MEDVVYPSKVEAAIEIRARLFELERLAEREHYSTLAYLLRLAIIETNTVIGDNEPGSRVIDFNRT